MNVAAATREFIREEIRTLVREEFATVLRSRPLAAPIRHRTIYRGDSDAKKSVRLRVWETVAKALGSRFAAGLHLFLPSAVGGDASVLRGMGVPFDAMRAVDIDRKAIQEFSSLYPQVSAECSDVATSSLLLEEGSDLASIYLDFSSHVNDKTLSRIGLAANILARNDGVLACTVAVGREKDRNWGGSVESRMAAIVSHIAQPGVVPKALRRIEYMSETAKGPGSHMAVVVMQISRRAPRRSFSLPPVEKIDCYDLYRDVERLQNTPDEKLRLLINCSAEKTDALRKRVLQYPPPK